MKGSVALMHSPVFPRSPSEIIRRIVVDGESQLTLHSLLSSLGSQGFGFMFVVVALPVVVPLPPGVGLIPALLLLVWSLQRFFGQTSLWLPQWLGRRRVSPRLRTKIEQRGLPMCQRLERLCRSGRQRPFLREQEIRFASLTVAVMSLLISLPTPFLNTIPAIITILIGLSLLSGNRRLLWVNITLGLLTTVLLGSMLYMGIDLLFVSS